MVKFSLGLSMIVKDEHHVILRVLESIYKHIDHWTIVDTGSTDGTQDLIKNFFKDKNIPGDLIETPWVDFSTCRNVALENTEKFCEWGIWIDADEEFIPDSKFDISKFLIEYKDLDTIAIPTRYGPIDYTRKSIWKCGKNFKWKGPIHEILCRDDESGGGIIIGAHVLVRSEGSSWQNIEEKYKNHAKILSEYTEIDKDPRWIFYTAQSFRDSGNIREAFNWYKKRAESKEDGFIEEIFVSRYMMARIGELLDFSKTEILALYNEAHSSDNTRGEAIKGLVQYLHKQKDFELAYIYSQYGLRYNLKNPYPNRILFLDKDLYQFQMMELHSLSCYYTKRIEEGSKAYWQMRMQIQPDTLTPEQETIILDNAKYFMPMESVFKTNIAPKHKGGSNYTPPKKRRR